MRIKDALAVRAGGRCRLDLTEELVRQDHEVTLPSAFSEQQPQRFRALAQRLLRLVEGTCRDATAVASPGALDQSGGRLEGLRPVREEFRATSP